MRQLSDIARDLRPVCATGRFNVAPAGRMDQDCSNPPTAPAQPSGPTAKPSMVHAGGMAAVGANTFAGGR